LTNIGIVREYPLQTLPDHAEKLVDEIGEYFTWTWPFFDGAMTGRWETVGPPAPVAEPDDGLDARDRLRCPRCRRSVMGTFSGVALHWREARR
jgi:hypothetical protein